MAYKVPANAKRGAGKTFISKGAYLQWCNEEIKHERINTYRFYDGATFIQRKMFGKTRARTIQKRYNRFANK